MILAIRALRATIFAFNASIWVSRPALASVTDDAAVIADPARLPDVAIAENEPAITGANTVGAVAEVAFLPPTYVEVPIAVPPTALLNVIAGDAVPSATGLPEESLAVTVTTIASPGAYAVLSNDKVSVATVVPPIVIVTAEVRYATPNTSAGSRMRNVNVAVLPDVADVGVENEAL